MQSIRTAALRGQLPGPRVSPCASCATSAKTTREISLPSLCRGGAPASSPMRLPALGAPLQVTLQPENSSGPVTLEARVTAVRLDPSDARRTGFEVTFDCGKLSREARRDLDACVTLHRTASKTVAINDVVAESERRARRAWIRIYEFERVRRVSNGWRRC